MKFINKWRVWFLAITIVGLLVYAFILPQDLFQQSTSFVLLDKDGTLLGARIAEDEQWRFPFVGPLPEKYVQCIITFEDRRFKSHIGFDFKALIRAAKDNWKAKRVVSGGSTLTMQTISLYRQRKSQNLLDKLAEVILATRLELRYSKIKILELYAANAPFGGNVVGIDAACWRYFKKDKSNLTWSESALLAILPNSPALIHPGKNRERLLQKRNKLLQQLADNDIISSLDLELALAEELPLNPYPLPSIAPHLLERAKLSSSDESNRSRSFISTLQVDIQMRANQIAEKHQGRLQENGINHLAILVADIKTGEILAYVGNVPGSPKGSYVDIITSARSPGSLLKPFLYHWAIQYGDILPNELLPDIPVFMKGFRPENFHKRYDGAIPASQALSRSLNIPFALLLKDFGPDRFLRYLHKSGFGDMNNRSAHYGLSLILGGVEASLWDLCKAYRLMALSAISTKQYPNLHFNVNSESDTKTKNTVFHPGAAYLTLSAMSTLERPDIQGQWKRFESARNISWKTGTSHGFRDAWAIGMDQKYIVGVWAGNANGEGRPGLIGVEAAAPVLFDIFNQLEPGTWFNAPTRHLKSTKVCGVSGRLASSICPFEWISIPASAKNMKVCSFHKEIAIDTTSHLRVHGSCAEPGSYVMNSYFVLPPVQEMYYRANNPSYSEIPEWKSGCTPNQLSQETPMQWVYPKPGMTLSLPKTSPINTGEAVLKLAHQNPFQKVFWFLDRELIGSSTEFHQISIKPLPGQYLLTCVDESGYELKQWLKVEWTE